jgi:hypothetical protein
MTLMYAIPLNSSVKEKSTISNGSATRSELFQTDFKSAHESSLAPMTLKGSPKGSLSNKNSTLVPLKSKCSDGF